MRISARPSFSSPLVGQVVRLETAVVSFGLRVAHYCPVSSCASRVDIAAIFHKVLFEFFILIDRTVKCIVVVNVVPILHSACIHVGHTARKKGAEERNEVVEAHVCLRMAELAALRYRGAYRSVE